MSDKEVVIKITAKNLTDGEVSTVRRSLASLKDDIAATKPSLDGLAAGMSTAGREASSSAKLITGMSQSGREAMEAASRAAQDQATQTKGFLSSLTGYVKQHEEQLQAVGGRMQTFGLGLSAVLSVPIVAAGGAIVKFGMDAVESENLVSVSFGDMKGSADDWSKHLSESLGLNQFEMRQTAGTLFNMTTSMGIGRQAAFDMSTGVTELAADMSSFRNIGFDEALMKIRSGLTGEAEPLKAIGILVDDATVKTYAYKLGIAKQGEELTAQQKVLARYQAILAQTSNDQGDLARTLDSPANQLRLMKTRVEEAATSLGVALMPTVQTVISGVSQLVPYVQSAVQWFAGLPHPLQLTAIAGVAVAAALGPVMYVMGTMLSSLPALVSLWESYRATKMAVAVAEGVAAATTVEATAATVAAGAASTTAGAAMSAAATVARTAWLSILGPIGAAVAALALLHAAAEKYGDASRLTDDQLRKEIETLRAAGGQMALSRAAAFEAALAKREHAKATDESSTSTSRLVEEMRRSSAAMQTEIAEQLKVQQAAADSADKIKAQEKAEKEAAKQKREFAASIADVARGLKTLNDGDFSKEFNTKVRDMVRELEKLGKTGTDVPEAIRAAMARLDAIDFEKLKKKLTADALEVGFKELERNVKATADAVERESQRSAKAMVENFTIAAEAAKAAEDERRKLTMSSYELEVTTIREAGEAKKRQLHADVAGYAEAMAAIEREVAEKMRQAADAHGREIDRMIRDAAALGSSWSQAFDRWTDAASTIVNSLQQIGGNSESTFGSIVRDVASVVDALQTAKASMKQFGDGLSTWQSGDKVGGAADMAAGALGAYSAMDEATGSGSRAKRVLGGAATGAKIGMAAGPVGAAVGAGIGAVVGVFRGPSKGETLNDQRDAWVEQITGITKNLPKAQEELRRLAKEAGVSDQAISKLLSERKLDALGPQIESITQAITDGQERVARGFENLPGAINARAEAFTASTAHSLGEVERLGQFTQAAFAGMVKHGSSVLDAFSQLSPAIDAINAGMVDTGSTGNAAITQLLAMRDVTTAFHDQFAALDADRQMLEAFGDAGIQTAELFQSFGTDVGAQFREIEAAGGNVNLAMAMQQPLLQQLWEAQQKYGAVTDETTASILAQAEEQGIVGADMKNVNERILDVLTAIGKVLGADLPAALQTFSGSARDAARTTVDNIGSIKHEYQTFTETVVDSRVWRTMEDDIAIAAQSGIDDFGAMTDEIDRFKKRIGEPITVQVNYEQSDVPGGSGGGSGQSAEMRAYLRFREDFLRANPGDEHRVDAAWGRPVPTHHTGGAVRRAHTGWYVGSGMSSDEVPIIAQVGEGILSRDRGMPTLARALGRTPQDALNSLNAGIGGASGHVVVNLYLAQDPQGNWRPLDEGHRRQIQDWHYGGRIAIPSRSITERTR